MSQFCNTLKVHQLMGKQRGKERKMEMEREMYHKTDESDKNYTDTGVSFFR